MCEAMQVEEGMLQPTAMQILSNYGGKNKNHLKQLASSTENVTF